MNGMMTNDMMASGMMNPMMSGFGLFMGLLWLLLFAALVVGVFFFVRWLLSEPGRKALRDDRALEIARTRFAKGELDADEFKAIKQALEAER